MRKYLRPLEREGLLVLWHDEMLEAGQAWSREIEAQIRGADIILLLVSGSFLASDYCMNTEVPLAIEQHRRGEARVIPILLREADWKRQPFAEFQVLPADRRPLDAWPSPAAAWTHVVQKLRSIIHSSSQAHRVVDSNSQRPMEAGADSTLLIRPVVPARGHCFGRDAIVRELVASVLGSAPRPRTVLGPPGIGKSTVTLEALHSQEVIERFGDCRLFVRLDSATTAQSMLLALASTLGIPPTPEPWPQVRAMLASSPTLLVLDNAETPWEADRSAVEELLGVLAEISGVVLIVSVRGEVRPTLPHQAPPIVVPPLAADAARQLFCSIAWHVSPDDPSLTPLLEAQDGLPLAIFLLAHAADGIELSVLARLWEAKRSELLERPETADRLSSLAVSLSLSLQSPRMTEEAHRLLSVLACLPDGMALDDIEPLLLKSGLAGASTLCKVGLAFMEAMRLRQLSPIREHVRSFYPPAPEVEDRTVDHYLRRAVEEGEKVGAEGGASAVAWLAREVGNIDEVSRKGLAGPRAEQTIDTILAMTDFMAMSGYGSPRLLELAGQAAQQREDWRRATECITHLGGLLIARSSYQEARHCFEHALAHFEHAGAPHGQARCHRGLAELALRQARHEDVRTHVAKALPLYQGMGDMGGEGVCTYLLGESALRCSRLDEAYSCFERALQLFRRSGSLHNQANSMRSMGEVNLRRMRLKEARPLLQAALPLFQQCGDMQGEANCFKNLGEVSFNEEQYEQARACFEQALPRYEQTYHASGYAGCLLFLGRIAQRNSRFDQALEHFEHALGIFQEIGNPLGQGNCYLSAGEIAEADEDFDEAFRRYEQALEFYSSIPDPYMVDRARRHLMKLELKLRGGIP